MTSTRITIGDERFWLDADTAAEVMRLAATDRPAALALARRAAAAGGGPTLPVGGRVSVPMMLMDAAPVPPLPPVHPQRTQTMPTSHMVKLTLGDHTHYVDQRVATELEGLRGENAALKALMAGTVQSPAGQQGTVRPSTAHLSDAEVFRADEAARNDPNTAQGKYRQYLQNAYKHTRP